MDTHSPYQDEVWEQLQDLRRGPPALATTALSSRLVALRAVIEREYPLSLAVDIVNREAVDRLPSDLTDAMHSLLREAVVNVAEHAKASLLRLTVQVNGGMVLIGIEDDGEGLPFVGLYDLRLLQSLGVGPLRLAEGVAALGGTMILDSRINGTRLYIALPREASTLYGTNAARAA